MSAVKRGSWHQLRPWPELMRAAKRRLEHEQAKPVLRMPCRMVLSFTRNGNGLLTVRCECMAGTVNKPAARYYNYEHLGERLTFSQARDLWAIHVAARELEGDDHAGQQDNPDNPAA